MLLDVILKVFIYDVLDVGDVWDRLPPMGVNRGQRLGKLEVRSGCSPWSFLLRLLLEHLIFDRFGDFGILIFFFIFRLLALFL